MDAPQPLLLPWYRWLSSDRVIRLLEAVQDFIVICLCVGLFSFMVLQLNVLCKALSMALPTADLGTVTWVNQCLLLRRSRRNSLSAQDSDRSIGAVMEVAEL